MSAKINILISLNREATGNRDRWRLLANGDERLVAGILIPSGLPIFTTSMVIQTGELKHYIQCDANSVTIEDDLAIIK